MEERIKIDKKCMDRLHQIHTIIMSATKAGTVAKLRDPKKDPIVTNPAYDLNVQTNKSRATLFRDLALLTAKRSEGGFGAPIKFDSARSGYYYENINYGFVIDTDSSSPENLLSLANAKILLSSLSNETPIYRKIAEVTDQITGFSSLMERIAIAPRQKKEIDKDLWKKISTSLIENKVLKLNVRFFGMTQEYTLPYTFCPYQLIFDQGNYYLWGKELWDDKDDTKNPRLLLNLLDIKDGDFEGSTFELPTDYKYNKEQEEYKVKLFSTARDEIVNCAFAEKQKILEKNDEEKSITVKFMASEFLNVHKWILSQGANAIPLSPQDLVDAWENEIYCLIQNSGINVDWLLLNRKESIKILKNSKEIKQERINKIKASFDNEDITIKEHAQNKVYEYLALLLLVRTHISRAYLRTMSYRDFAKYVTDIIPSISKVEILHLAKKLNIINILESADSSDDERLSFKIENLDPPNKRYK